MHQTTIYLASSSPRRSQLLRQAGFNVSICPSFIDETPLSSESPELMVERLARLKLEAARIPRESIGIAADTTVAINGEILGKPNNADEALVMLKKLSGKIHHVFSGFAVGRSDLLKIGVVKVVVAFRTLTMGQMERYIQSGEPFDKAGGYGIQGEGAFLVDWIHGSYTGIMGLPLTEVCLAINELNDGSS